MNLKNCPFCGGEAEAVEIEVPGGDGTFYPEAFIRCMTAGCGVEGILTTPADAVAAWNRRAPDPAHAAALAVVDAAREFVGAERNSMEDLPGLCGLAAGALATALAAYDAATTAAGEETEP